MAYINYLSAVNDELSKISLKETFSIDDSISTIKNTELIVPVIGAFSAGKSTLLNSFLEDKKLPEKITPETALATELRYSKDERIEAIKADKTLETFNINDMELIKKRANEFKYLRMYLNNINLKNIEPLILVDMPGFESPLDLHNQAIIEYIDKGVHYIVLSSVEDGNITKSMVRQLENIQEYKRDFSFFISKTNLKPQEEINEIKEKIQDQLEEYFDKSDSIGLVDDNGRESLIKILSTIDPEKLFENLFLEDLKDNYYFIIEAINTKISALGKSKEENQDAILKLQKALTETQKKRDSLIEEAKERYEDTNINRIVESIGRDLSDNLDEIVLTGMHGGSSALSNKISEITRSSLTIHIKNSMSEISDDIIENFSVSLLDINSTMSNFTLSENWIKGITDTTKKLFDNTKGGIDNIIKRRKSQPEKDNTYKAVTTVLAISTEVIAPVFELVIVFLPEILEVLFAHVQETKQKAQLQDMIITNTIPSLKRELRNSLPKIFNSQVNELILNISEEFQSIIEEKQLSIEATQKEITNKNIDLEANILAYKEVHATITSLANKALYRDK